MKKSLLSLGCFLFSSMFYVKNAFAGDKLFNVLGSSVSSKPDTGDSNTMIIYGSLAVIALIILIGLNIKDSKKNKDNDKNDEEN